MRWTWVFGAALGAPWLCGASIAQAPPHVPATYHVTASNASAADTGPGSAERPWRTIGRAAREALPGDTVVVHAGVYREAVEPASSGVPGAPITYMAQPGDTVVVTGADPITEWSRVPGDEPLYQTPWNHVFAIDQRNGKPVEHHPEDAPLWGRAEIVLSDSAQLRPFESAEALRRAWKTRTPSGAFPSLAPAVANLGPRYAGGFAVDTTSHLLTVWLADGTDPRAHAMEAGARDLCFGVNPWAHPAGLHDIVVRGITFRHAATFPQRPGVWLPGERNLLEDCRIEEMSGSGVSLAGVMRRCTVSRCGHTGGGAQGDGFLNEDCAWRANCWKPISRGWDAGGFKMALAKGGVFRRCRFEGNGGPGLWLDIHVRDVLITECVFDGNEGSGVFVEISRDITVTRNLAIHNGIGVVGAAGPGSWSTAGIQIGESMNCTVTSNTCVDNADGIAIREQGPRPMPTDDFGVLPYHNVGHLVVSNVCAWNRGYQLGVWYDNAFFGWHPAEQARYRTVDAYRRFVAEHPENVYDPRAVGIVIDRNVYFATPEQHLVLYGVPWRPLHQVYDAVPGFTAATGFDTHSLAADPGFSGRMSDDWRPSHDGGAWRMGAGWLTPPVPESAGTAPTGGTK